ncbi:MAG: hypothetical protein HY731_04830 [Candidatus Tectomicrobia bacterium]|nr:hypothetical protein [Candidatus Tectomicrobia bacterium]
MRQPQWVPVAFGPLAGVITLVAAWWFEAITLRLFAIACSISMIIGGLGLYYHGMAVARNFESVADLLNWRMLFAALPHAPPLGAPMAFVGMGVIGLLVHTCALKLERVLMPEEADGVEPQTHTLTASTLFILAFLLLVLAPLSPMLIHLLF